MTVVPLATAPMVGALVLAAERTLTRVVVLSTVPMGKLPGASVAVGVLVAVDVAVAVWLDVDVGLTVDVLLGVDDGMVDGVELLVGVDVPVLVPVAVQVGDSVLVGVAVAVVVAGVRSTSAKSPKLPMYPQCVPCSVDKLISVWPVRADQPDPLRWSRTRR